VSAPPRSPRRALVFLGALVLVNLGGAYALDALSLVESLLAPSGARALFAAALALFFYAARLLLYFLAPGLAIAAIALARARRDHVGSPPSTRRIK
jgi:hypothetical protein